MAERRGGGRDVRVAAAVLALLAGVGVGVGAACGGDDGGSGGGTRPGSDVGGAIGRAGLPADTLVGETDTDTEHWDDGEPWEPPYGSTFRAYGGDVWSTVGDYPQAANHCASAQRRVSWRSLGGPLIAGLTTYASDGEQQTFATAEAPSDNAESNDGWIDVEAEEPATDGEMVLSACEQPVFRTTETNVLEDFVVEVTQHSPRV